MRRGRTLVLVLGIALAAVVAACGDDGGDDDTSAAGGDDVVAVDESCLPDPADDDIDASKIRAYVQCALPDLAEDVDGASVGHADVPIVRLEGPLDDDAALEVCDVGVVGSLEVLGTDEVVVEVAERSNPTAVPDVVVVATDGPGSCEAD